MAETSAVIAPGLAEKPSDAMHAAMEQLQARMSELERRMNVLEGRPETTEAVPGTVAKTTSPQQPVAETWAGFPSFKTQFSAVPILGNAVVGMAGAYLFRAIAESTAIPKLPVLVLAIGYACLWMVLAVRARRGLFATVTYACTSVLILSPLLWESTVRFEFFSAGIAGAILIAYVILAFALTWKSDLGVIPSVAMLAAANTALALIFTTHELIPLTVSLLALALVTEVVVFRGGSFPLRAAPAIAADAAVFLMIAILTASTGVPERYHAASAALMSVVCLSLLTIYFGSIAVRTFLLRRRLTAFEIVQGALASFVVALGGQRIGQGSFGIALGASFLLLAGGCYWATLSRFAEDSDTRNRRVFATWAAALLLAGSYLVFRTNVQVAFLSVAAIVSSFVYVRREKVSLGLHASLFLAAAAGFSSGPAYVINTMAGTVPSTPDWTTWFVAVSALACYIVGFRKQEGRTVRRLLWIVPALVVSAAATSMIVAGFVALASGHVELTASKLSVIRTVVNCALSLGLGYAGSRWSRAELGWAAYAAVGFGTLKLLFEDLRIGNAESLVVSLLFYGLVLILLPRTMRGNRNESTAEMRAQIAQKNP